MPNLVKNARYYKIEIEDIEELEKEKYQENVNETLISPITYDKNRALYLLFKNQDIKMIKGLLENMSEKSAIIYLYDNANEIVRILSYFNNAEIKNKIRFFKINNDLTIAMKEIDDLLGQVLYYYTQIYPVIKVEDDIQYLTRAREIMTQIRKKRDNFKFLLGNDLNDTLYGLENRLINLKQYSNNPGINDFVKASDNRFVKKPAVIVASGPSLDENIHYLKEFQDDILIFCCDGSYSTLIKNGIKAHFIGSVERVNLTYQSFYENRTFDKNLLLIAPAVVRPEIANMFKDRLISVFKDKDSYGVLLDNILNNEKGRLWCGSSVAHLLFSFADSLGCDPIILVGQDLCSRLDGVTHANDSEVKEIMDINDDTVWLKGNYEELVPSTDIWEKFLLTYNELVEITCSKVINSTAGGAYINGTELLSFSDALKKYCLEPLKKPIDIYNSITDYNNFKNYEEQIANKFGAFYDKFLKFEKKLSNSVELNKKAIIIFNRGIKTQKQLNTIYDALEFVENKIVKAITTDGEVMMLFQYPIQKAIHEINSIPVETYTLESLAINLKVHREMLQVMHFNCKRVIRVIKKSAESLVDYEDLEWFDDEHYDIYRN